MKFDLAKFTVYLFFAALLLNFFCILSCSSNTLALALLATCYPLALLVTGVRPRFTWYHALFALFIVYLALHKTLFFPEAKIFAFSRKAVLAFLAGMAAFQLLKDRNMNFMYLMNLVLPFVIAGIAVLTAFGYIPYESLFWHSRLALAAPHAPAFGIMLCICLMSGLYFLFRKNAGDSLCAVLITTDSGRLATLFCKTVKSKPFVSCGMLLSLGLLLPTFSKTAILTTAIVGGLFSIYIACKRWGLLRSAALCIFLALCAVAAWHLAPIEQQRKEHFYNTVLNNALTPWKYPTFISRIPIWESGILAVKENPSYGVGPNGFGNFHQKRVHEDYVRLVSIYGQDIIDGDTLRIGSPHSTYLQWFAETGIIGGMLFCLLLFAPLFYCLKKRTLCGEMGLILAAYAICFFFEGQVHGGRTASFSTTVIFITFGYFSGILGQRQNL